MSAQHFFRQVTALFSKTREASRRNLSTSIESLEERLLLTTFLVDSVSDSADDAAGVNDGLVSLREAVTAAETNAAFGDAPAGSGNDVIKFAGTIKGETISLNQGQFVVTDDLRIVGADREMVIDANFASRFMDVYSSKFVASGLSIINGASEYAGGAFAFTGDGNRKLRSMSIQNNTTSDSGGGAIHQDGGVLLISESLVTDNGVSDGRGGAVFLTGGTLTVQSSILKDNYASKSGGAIEIAGGKANVFSSKLEANVAGPGSSANPGSGGAIHVRGNNSRLRIVGSLLTNNEAAHDGGAIWNSAQSAVTVGSSTTLSNNFAHGESGGGAIYNDGGLIQINRANLMANVADGPTAGGGAIFSNGGRVVLNESLVSSNVATQAGGGIKMFNGGLTLRDTTIGGETVAEGNIAGLGEGVGTGGGLSLSGDIGTSLYIRGGAIENNSASHDGGGIWISNGRATLLQSTFVATNFANGDEEGNGGGGIFNSGATVRLYDATLAGNVAGGVSGSGGGIYSDNGNLQLNGVTVSSNVATRSGGGLEIHDATVTILNSILGGETKLDGNEAGDITGGNPANPGSGGGLHVSGPDGSKILIAQSQVLNNSAALEGGGLWNDTASTMVLSNGVLVRGNAAGGDASDSGGGGIYNDGGTVMISDAEIDGNVAFGEAGSGGGIFSNNGVLQLLDTKIAGNSANRAGGGIEVVDGSVLMRRVDIGGTGAGEANVAGINGNSNPGNGGGVHLTGGVYLRATDTSIVGNFASQDGGGIWSSADSRIRLTDSRVSDNEAFGDSSVNGGGGIYNDGGTVDLITTTVESNLSNGSSSTGAGIYNDGLLRTREVSIVNNTNFSGESGGGIFTTTDAITSLNNSVTEGNSPDDFGGPGRVLNG